MCFTIDELNKEEKTAEQDITCYKISYKRITLGFYSLFQNFYYQFDKKYHINKLISIKIFGLPIPVIEKGFHSYIKLEDATKYLLINEFIIECIIPKGSKYYENNKRGEYVSDTIICFDKKFLY